MQIAGGDRMASSAIARRRARSGRRSARAAASAYGPPEPIADEPSSGSITSPVPERMNDVLAVGHDEQRLQAAQRSGRVRQSLASSTAARGEVAAVLLQLGLEALEQREGVGGGAGEAGQHAAVVQPAHLARVGLHHRLAERDLAVAAERHRGRGGAREHDGGGRIASITPAAVSRVPRARSDALAGARRRRPSSGARGSRACSAGWSTGRAWPRSSWISRRSAPSPSRWVAKVWRSVCGRHPPDDDRRRGPAASRCGAPPRGEPAAPRGS